MKKICVVTGSRAEYGLLFCLLKKLKEDSDFDLRIVATGMHLSSEFGLTYKAIESDGFKIHKKIEMLISSDSPSAITKSMAVAQITFADYFKDHRPDLILLLGDRYEMLVAAIAGLMACIPMAHIHGGELTEGAIDESIRHSITKMSHLHFVSTELYRKRVVQLGEEPNRVFNVGALGLEYMKEISLLTRKELSAQLGIEWKHANLLVTFHPETLNAKDTKKHFEELLSALSSFENTQIIFTKANADSFGREINTMIDFYVEKHSTSACVYTSLGSKRYLSLMGQVDAVIGNSSSGIIEAPSLKIPTVNIGERQKGRVQAESVFNCAPVSASICEAIRYVISSEFKRKLDDIKNPYEQNETSGRIIKILKGHSDIALIKKFYDFDR